jgi:hypothetical protein
MINPPVWGGFILLRLYLQLSYFIRFDPNLSQLGRDQIVQEPGPNLLSKAEQLRPTLAAVLCGLIRGAAFISSCSKALGPLLSGIRRQAFCLQARQSSCRHSLATKGQAFWAGHILSITLLLFSTFSISFF